MQVVIAFEKSGAGGCYEGDWKSVEGPGVVARRRRDVQRWAKSPFKRRIWCWQAGCQSTWRARIVLSVDAIKGEGNGEVLRAMQMASS